MKEYVDIIILLLTFGLGLVFLRFTISIVSFMGRLNNFIFGKLALEKRLIERFKLMEDDPLEYSRKFPHEVTIIRISGIVCLFISISGFCLAILDNVTKRFPKF